MYSVNGTVLSKQTRKKTVFVIIANYINDNLLSISFFKLSNLK